MLAANDSVDESCAWSVCGRSEARTLAPHPLPPEPSELEAVATAVSELSARTDSVHDEALRFRSVLEALAGAAGDAATGGDVDAWDRAVDLVLVSMPASHFNTLQYLLLILAKVALNIADTRMDAGNLGKVLAPTVFRSPRAGSDDSDPAQLFGEITLAGKVLTRLISRKLELEAASIVGGNGTDDTSNLNAEEEIESRLSNRVKSMAFKRGGR